MIPKQDRIHIRTSAQLEQKYNFDEKFRKVNSQSSIEIKVQELSQTLQKYMVDTNLKLEEMGENDKMWFYSGEPTLENYPAVDWNTDELKLQHRGDMYYDIDNGNMYIFKYVDETYFWQGCFDSESESVVYTRLKDIVEGNLTKIVDDTITEIGGYVFYKNKYFTKLDLPNCTIVRSYGLNGAEIPIINMPKLETIEANGFIGCTVTEVNFPVLVDGGTGTFSSCSALTRAVLGSIATVGASCFYTCKKLAYCDLGTEVTSIGTQAFRDCSALTTLIIRNASVVPTIQSNTFTSSAIASGTGFVYVPDDLVESYKAAANWSTYANQIKGLSELPSQTS